jgi:hypothetical protein
VSSTGEQILQDRVINYLMHQVPDSSGVRPVAVLSVGHVDDVDLLKVGRGLPLHDVGARPGERRSCLHRAQTAVADCD